MLYSSSDMISWKKIVELYDMQPHPEGGYYKETFRSTGLIPHSAIKSGGYAGDRGFSTAIFYLLPEGAKSKLHRLKSDEVFHFYLGGPITMVKLGVKGEVETVTLGQDIAAGQQVQHVVKAGHWFGGYCNDGSPFSLIGCTVAPGFDFADFEMADKQALLKQYPSARALIERLMA